MRYRLLDADRPADLEAWRTLWEAWPRREVMAHPDYARLFARDGDRAVCAVGEDGDATILLPLVLRPLAREAWAAPGESRWDATSPYGFGGPFTWGGGAGRDDVAFWCAHEAFCREARVVSTFLRLSLFPHELAAIPGRVEVRAPNVVRDLRPGLEAVWRDYDHRVRTNVRNAQRAGLRFEIDETGATLDAFLDVYAHTMDRRNARDWYYFPRPFFERILERLRGQFAFVNVVAHGEIVSSELILSSRTRLYGFLGGTREDAFKLRPNDLVRHGQVVWGIESGKEELVLGGGYAPDDGILRHKRHLAPGGEVPFKVAMIIHDEPAYFDLVRSREAQARAAGVPWAPREGYFPLYRG